jgi:hypothetical protein
MTAKLVRVLLGAVALGACLPAAAACSGGADDGAAPSTSPPTRSPASGSGNAAHDTAPTPTPSPDAPVVLAPGEPASVSLGTVGGADARVDVTVTEVVRGDIEDLSAFELGPAARRSTPYYAHATVTSTGRASPSASHVPLWGLDSTGTVRPPADVIGSFRRCQPRPLPARMSRGESVRTCLIYLLPEGTRLEAVQYRFSGDHPPYTWPVR